MVILRHKIVKTNESNIVVKELKYDRFVLYHVQIFPTFCAPIKSCSAEDYLGASRLLSL